MFYVSLCPLGWLANFLEVWVQSKAAMMAGLAGLTGQATNTASRHCRWILKCRLRLEFDSIQRASLL